jgi:hypothetical protein
MTEKEPRKEAIGRGELYFLWHPATPDTFSGYGLTTHPGSKELLVGLLMVDRPQPVDPDWLDQVEATFGEYELVAMTASGERGIACHMQIEPDSQPYLRQLPLDKAAAIEQALAPLLEAPPKPGFRLRWDEALKLWTSELIIPNNLPPELQKVFERTGPGCAAAETNIGVVHICHAADRDIEGFANKPMWCRWELVLLPTAPVLRLNVAILDRPQNPFRFESFLNIGDEEQARILETLVTQEKLYFPFYGQDFRCRFTKVVEHSPEQRRQLQELVVQARDHWQAIPEARRNFDQAKIEFQQRFSF